MNLEEKFRQLPSVDRVLLDVRIGELCGVLPREVVADLIRQRLGAVRWEISQGGSVPSLEEIVSSIVAQARELGNPSLQPVINATGVILHTNLGRAPLSAEATRAMELASHKYCNLEFDLESGRRGTRQVHVEQLLCQLTGAEAALVVNNNASGVLLALSALARRKEVIVSRGQAVEIGGGFRIPEVMRQSGAKLVEVGTTNCTYLSDYEQAITPRTAILLRVHASNFRITGFTHSVSLEELVGLGQRYNLPVLDDLGSGCLVDTTRFGLDREPMLQESVAAGAALVFSSGDKLLGGPQAGLIVGRKELIERLRRHPLARAARIDKVRLAGLAATLLHYLRGEALERIPVLRLLAASLEEVERRARMWAQALGEQASVVPGESMVGGGSLPGSGLPTYLVVLRIRGRVQDLARRLRQSQPPIIGRVGKNSLVLDPRSVLPGEDEILIRNVRQALAGLATGD